jgi:hydroxyacylglutathione hydrolase
MSFKIHILDVKNTLQNYIWLLEHEPSQTALVVDPTEANIVIEYCQQQQLTLTHIWLTHWHKDHIGGVPDLQKTFDLQVFGPAAEQAKIPMLNHALQHQDQIEFQGLHAQIIAVPGHTLGHIVYHLPELKTLFCGDTLFAMGCGRVFEGTYQQMFDSLQRLAALPEHTQVYCTHEYTLSNAEFALHVLPDNTDIQQRFQQVKSLRAVQRCTLPSEIGLERRTNPFLLATNVAEFQRLRELKDHF